MTVTAELDVSDSILRMFYYYKFFPQIMMQCLESLNSYNIGMKNW